MPADDHDSRRDRLAVSARGWHRIQLAALGFIGLCGVLWSTGESNAPQSVNWIAALLALVAIVLQGVAVYLVGTVAYPFYGAPAGTGGDGADSAGDEQSLDANSQRLRRGIRMTYGAVGLVVVATLAAWWPDSGDSVDSGVSGLVEVRDAEGTSVCGELVDSAGGELALETADGAVRVSLGAIAELGTVTEC